MKRTAGRAPRKILAAIATGALALGAVVAAPIAANAAEVQVDDVTFDWGLSAEAGGGAFFGGCNFLSAGAAGDTGSSRLWTQADGLLKATEGNVSVLKPVNGSDDVPITWQNKCLSPAGTAVTSANTSVNTGVHVQISDGAGTVGDDGSVDISWSGSFSVVFYGGLTYWTASDPRLVLDAEGDGQLTATASGYGADMEDTSKWVPLEPKEIVLADISGAEIGETGFTAAPDYRGVTVDTGDGLAQVRSGASWGSFPQSFVDYQVQTGQSSYWYSSGLSRDPAKVATPLTVSYELPAPATAITTQPVAQTVTLGEQATFSVGATGATAYQWESAAIGGDGWAAISGATSAEYTVAGTTANAKQYRVVVSGSGDPVASAAVALTVNVPTPSVTVSKTEGLNAEGDTVTVTGKNFLPNAPATTGTRPPLAGKFTGAYISFSSLAAGGTFANYANGAPHTRWGVLAADLATIDPTGSGAGVEITADGTFTAEVSVLKYAPANGGTLGIRTYAAGGSAYAAFTTFTPITFAIPTADAPAAPTAVLGADRTSIDVSWTAPDDNGAAITGYDVTLVPSSGEALKASVAGDVLVASFDDLEPGVSYTATVVAKNAGGSSAVSAASASVSVPADAPAAPAAPDVVPALTSAAVSWIAPADGGSAITGYTVKVSQGGEVVATASTDGATAVQVDGLVRGTAYTVSVAATNGVGTSAESATSAFSTLAELPAAPTEVKLILAAQTGNAIWTLPDDGGSPLTKQVVDVYSGGELVKSYERSGSSSLAILTGLTKGTAYTATVTAFNALGSTTSAPSAPVRTLADPALATVTATLVGTDAITVTWVDGDLGGGKLDQHFVGLFEGDTQVGGATVRAADAEQSHTFTGLTPGKTYVAKVETTTVAVGSSGLASSAEVRVPTAPDAVVKPDVVVGADGTSATITWAAPNDGGSAITQYGVALVAVGSEDIVVDFVPAEESSYSFVDLEAGRYQVLVAAENAVGWGAGESSLAEFSVAGPAPAEAPVLVTDEDLTEESSGPGAITVGGGTAKIELGVGYANEWVGIAVNSDPIFLGWFLTDASGTVTVTLPSGLAAGTHHVVVYAADGSVVAYQAFTVGAVPAGELPITAPAGQPVSVSILPATGQDAAAIWPLAGLGFLILAAGAVLVIRRRMARADA